MSSIAYVSYDYHGKASVYTNSVQSFRMYHHLTDDKPVARRPNWWEAQRMARKCSKLMDKKLLALEEVKR